MSVKYPDIKVRLSGTDGNAMSIIAHVTTGMRHHKVPAQDIDAFVAEAMSGDYDGVIQTAMKWVDVS